MLSNQLLRFSKTDSNGITWVSINLSLEFGWLDMKFRCWLEMVRFWNRVCETDNHRWPKKITRRDLSLKASGWSDQVSRILDYADMNTNLSYFNKVDLDVLEKKFKRKTSHYGYWK